MVFGDKGLEPVSSGGGTYKQLAVEIAKFFRTGVPPVAAAETIEMFARVTASLDEPVGEDATPLGDLVADVRARDPFESAMAAESRDEVSSMLRLLPERHREVIVRRYGLSADGVQTHEQIGERLGVGEERSRQIEREALHRLRSIAAARAA